MAHYALINKYNNQVTQVITGVDENVTQTDLDGTVVGGSSEAWEAFYEAQANDPTIFVKRTSYNGNFRKQYAAVGFTYDADADVFIGLQRFPSWTLDENHDWQPPTPMPTDGGQYRWAEAILEWVAI